MSLEIQGLSKAFAGTRALDDVTLDVPSGSLTALLGPSGCGKTTLLRTIAGFERPDRGRIVSNGTDITHARLGTRDIGFVFQSYALFPHLTVADNIAFGLSVRGAAKDARSKRVGELLELVRLPGYERRMPHQLSGGQRQRVALARALAAKPAFLLLDEPFAALDLTVRRELRRWLRSLHEETHVTTLLVTHDPDEAMDIADNIVLMHDGRVQQSGSPGTLYAEPATPFVMTFIGEANAIETDGRTVYVRPHEVLLERAASASGITGTAERIVDFGSRVQVELRLGDDRIVAELSDARFRELGCTVGGTYDVVFTRTRSFARASLATAPVKEELPA